MKIIYKYLLTFKYMIKHFDVCHNNLDRTVSYIVPGIIKLGNINFINIVKPL